jgi:hypothetical protein
MKIFRGVMFLTLIFFVNTDAHAQASAPKPCESPDASQFDFWLGEWDLSWPAEQSGGKQGEIGTGTNSITRMFGRCVVKEDFNSQDAGLRGHSVSVYNVGKGRWQQTWVDDQGGYLLFSGEFKTGKMTLQTEPFLRGEKTLINRMVFRNITPNSLDWDWQTSADSGKTWEDLWNIHYAKKGSVNLSKER